MGMIRARISDEIEQQIQERIEKLKQNSRGGMEVNLSTVIRYSLEKYIEEQNELDKGIMSLKFDLEQFDDEELKLLKKVINELSEIKTDKTLEKAEFIFNLLKLKGKIMEQLYIPKED